MSENTKWDFEDEEWVSLEEERPNEEQACYYLMEVAVRGWYKPHEKGLFYADPGGPPLSRVVAWQPWKTELNFKDRDSRMKNVYPPEVKNEKKEILEESREEDQKSDA